MTQYCTFRLDGHLFGVPVEQVQEVLRAQEVTPVPLSARAISGLINLRGQIVTTVELRALLGIEDRAPESASVCVVVRSGDGSPVSLVADSIGDVLDPDPDRLEAPPETVPDRVRAVASWVCKLDDELLLVLDAERVTRIGGAA